MQSYSLPYFSELNSFTSGIRARLATSESCLDSLSLLAGHASTLALEATDSAFAEPNKSYPVQDLRLDTLKQPIYFATPIQFDQLPPLSFSHSNSVLVVQPPTISLRVPSQKSSSLSPKSKQHVLGASPRVAQLYRQAAPALRSRPLPRVKAISRRSREFYEQFRAANRRSAPPGLFSNAVKPVTAPPPVPFLQTLKLHWNKQALSSSSTAQAKTVLRATPISPPIISETTPQRFDLNSNSKELQSKTSAQPTATLQVESPSGTDTQQQLPTQITNLHNFEELDQKLQEALSAQPEPVSEAAQAAAVVSAPAPTSSHDSPAHTRINYSDLIDPSAVLVLSASSIEPTNESPTPPPEPAELPHRPHQISPISEEEPSDASEDEYYSLAPDTNKRYSAVVVELNRRFSALELRALERERNQETVDIPRRPESAVVCDSSQVELVLESFVSQPLECVSEITLTEAEAVEQAMATRPQTQPPPVQAPLRVATTSVPSPNGPSDSVSAFANSPDTGATSSAVSTLDRDTVVLRNSRPSPLQTQQQQQPPQPQPRTSVAARQSVAETPQRASIAASQATLEAPSASASATESSARVLYATRMQAVELTVFQERALVHRACSLQLPAGPTEICIKSLPHSIDKDSIRCACATSTVTFLNSCCRLYK